MGSEKEKEGVGDAKKGSRATMKGHALADFGLAVFGSELHPCSRQPIHIVVGLISSLVLSLKRNWKRKRMKRKKNGCTLSRGQKNAKTHMAVRCAAFSGITHV